MPFANCSLGCGAVEYYGLYRFSTGDKVIAECLYKALRPYGGLPSANLVIFGDGVAMKNGEAFAAFLTTNKLGTIVASEITKNPVHIEVGHLGYQAWFWHVDREALKAWYITKDKEFNPPAPPPVSKEPEIKGNKLPKPRIERASSGIGYYKVYTFEEYEP